MTVNIVTLGCAKNLVDSEHLLFQFKAAGYRVLHDDYTTPSELVILNTCGFILDAKEESIETILQFLEKKRMGHCRKVFVMGCLSERYRNELANELPEVDGFFGVWDMPAILTAAGRGLDPSLQSGRLVTTPGHYAYLKIAEGCNRTCAFCAIPAIRGSQQSVPVETLLEESRQLSTQGVRELILVAQDLTMYGTDLYRHQALPELLQELVALDGIRWIRLHYAYPAGFPLEVIELMSSEEKICNYLDIPIQHVNDTVLARMKRGHGRDVLERLLDKFRADIPGGALRTTLMTGFPGETEEAFGELLEFVQSRKFDRLGVFPYSHEEGTPAFLHLGDPVPDRVKKERTEALMHVQQEISLELNQRHVGNTLEVLIDRVDEDYLVGRTQFDSPDVDNEVFIPASPGLKPGEFHRVRITRAEAFDLFGEPAFDRD